MQAVEPAARLVDTLADIVGLFQYRIKLIFILKRIMHLRERHRAGIEPAVNHFGRTFHLPAAFTAGKSNVIHKRPV